MSKPPHSGIKLSQIRALVAVAECGNFGEAAWTLGLTQPSVSHAIASLEEELGVILVARGRHGAHLTPAGENVVIHFQDILRLLDVAVQEANLHKGLQGGQVRISTFRSAAAHLLPKIMAQFQAACPAIDVTIAEHYDYRFVEQDIRDGKADIGFTILPTDHDLETIEVLRDEYIVLLPATSEMRSTRLTWDELTRLPLMLYSDDNSCFATVQRYFLKAGHHLKPRYQFRETSTILNMVAQGIGVAIVPQLSAMSVPTGIRIGQLPSPLERGIGAAILANSLQTPAVFAFLGVLKQNLPILERLPA
ncbi:MAG TPA: LysR family transcriptional regulator [Elainellaceae cyanobacterium]